MTLPRDNLKWLLRSVKIYFLVSILAVFTAFYFSGKIGREEQIKSRNARALLTSMWNEIDDRWSLLAPIPKEDLDEFIKSKWGSETFANLTTFDSATKSNPLVVYDDPEARRSVQILFRDGGMTTWDRKTWKTVFITKPSLEFGTQNN